MVEVFTIKPPNKVIGIATAGAIVVAVTKFSAFELIAKPKADAHYTNISSAKYYMKNDLATGLKPTAQ